LSTRHRLSASLRDPELRHCDQLPANADSLGGDGYEIITNKAGKQSNTETLHPQHCFGASIKSGVRDYHERAALFCVQRHGAPARLGRCACSRQFGRISAPMIPQRVHTIRGPNAGTGT